MRRKFFQIITSLIAIMGVFVSCTTRVPEYFYIEQRPPEIPKIEEYMSPEALSIVNMEPEIIEEPETVNDILYDLAVYKEYYEAEHQIRTSLERYIKDINSILGANKNEIQD